MFALRSPRVATTLLCAPLFFLGCQPRLTAISDDEVSGAPFSSDVLEVGDTEAAVLSRVRGDLLDQRHRPSSRLPARAFGPASWREHFGVQAVGKVPSLPSDIDQILDRPCPFWPGQKVWDTHLLVLVPSEVDGVPYTLDKLGEVIRSRFPKNTAGYGYYDLDVKAQLGSVAPRAPYWVLLTRDVIPGSRNTSYEDQKKLLAARASKTSCDYGLPSALEASTAILAHYVRSSERLFADAPWTYSRCQDLVELRGIRSPAAVGGFGSSGLLVVNDFLYAFNNDGVSGCRKLSTRDTALPVHAFGPGSWREHFGVQAVGTVPSLPSDIDQILDSPCPFWSDKRVRDTHVLVLVPSEVDGEPYTLTRLGELIRSWFSNNSEGYRNYGSHTKAQLGSLSPQAPYWVLLTRDVIPGSRDVSYTNQKEMLAIRAREAGLDYCLPTALEASTVILAHYVRSGERLSPDDPWTYIRCQDLVQWSGTHYPAAVGGFGSSGLSVAYSRYDDDFSGVFGCRKF